MRTGERFRASRRRSSSGLALAALLVFVAIGCNETNSPDPDFHQRSVDACSIVAKASNDLTTLLQNYPGNPSAAVAALTDMVALLQNAEDTSPAPSGLRADIISTRELAAGLKSAIQAGQPGGTGPLVLAFGTLGNDCSVILGG